LDQYSDENASHKKLDDYGLVRRQVEKGGVSFRCSVNVLVHGFLRRQCAFSGLKV
jgi:hypothetical protein